jgi:hypothetical protein
MKRIVLLLSVLVPVLALSLIAAPKLPDALAVEVDRPVLNLYDSIEGQVRNLDVGESFTLELADGYGRVVAREEMKRKGLQGTPFRIQVRSYSTSVMTVRVTGTTGRKGSAQIQCVPPTPGWENIPVMTADSSAAKESARAAVLGILAIRTGFGRSLSDLTSFGQGNFRCLVFDAASTEPFVAPAVPAEPLVPAPPLEPVAPVAADAAKDPRAALKRVPSLAEPGAVLQASDVFEQQYKTLSPFGPLGYALFTSPGVTPLNAAVDWCFDDRTLDAFRTKLKGQYPSPMVLSRAWGTNFRRWEDVVPLTTPEILKREFPARKTGKTLNFSPWVDHRAFMDEQFASLVRDMVEKVHMTHPALRVGFLGGCAPAAFGGYDWSLLSQDANFVECTDETAKRLVASLNSQRVHPGYTVGTLSDQVDPGEFLRRLWTHVASGDLAEVILPGTNLLDAEGFPTPLARKARPSLVALEGLGYVMMDKDFGPAANGVYVYYSQPSVRVQYLLDAAARPAERKTGEPSDDLFTSTWHRNLRAWVDLLDDLGVEFEALSYRALSTRGWMRNAKVIILPKVVALSDAEATQLRQFVEQGGMLIADSQAGIFDEHGVEQQRNPLDLLFGVQRQGIASGEAAGRLVKVLDQPLRPHRESGRFKDLIEDVPVEGLNPVEPKLEPGVGAGYHLGFDRNHALITRPVGKGSTVYLNLSLINYPWDRADASKVAGLRMLLRRIFSLVEIKSHATLVKVEKTELPDVTLRQFRHRANDFVIALRRAPAPKAPEKPVAPTPAVEEPPAGEPAVPEPVQPVEPPPAPEPVPAPDAPTPAAEEPPKEQPLVPTTPDYRVKVADSVKVEVAGQPDLTRAPVIDKDGKINLALLGDIPVAGMTAAEIREKLTQMYVVYIVGVNVTVNVSTPKPEAEGAKEPALLKGDFFKIKLDRPRFVYDVIAGRYIGNTAEPLVFLGEGECGVFALLDYEVKGVDVKLSLRPLEMTYRLSLVAQGGTPGLHAFRMEFIDPKGKPIEAYAATFPAVEGRAVGVLNLALNDAPGEWTVRATDVLTGVKGEAKFTLK